MHKQHIHIVEPSSVDRIHIIFRCGDTRPVPALSHWLHQQLPIFNGSRLVDFALPGLVGIFQQSDIETIVGPWLKKVATYPGLIKDTVVMGHDLCLGHPVEGAQHRADTLNAARMLMRLGIFERVFAVFATVDHGVSWSIEEVDHFKPMEGGGSILTADSA